MDRSDPEIVEDYIQTVIREKQKYSYEFPDEVLALCNPEDLKEYDRMLDEQQRGFILKMPVTKNYNLRRKERGDPQLVAQDHTYDDTHHSRLVAEEHDYVGTGAGPASNRSRLDAEDEAAPASKRPRLDAEDEAMEDEDN